jgi:hypothetical protein
MIAIFDNFCKKIAKKISMYENLFQNSFSGGNNSNGYSGSGVSRKSASQGACKEVISMVVSASIKLNCVLYSFQNGFPSPREW